MRVAIVTESGEADAVRGIGVYTRELLNGLKDLENNAFSVELVNKDNPKLKNFQVLHYPDFRIYFSYPKLISGVKSVVTIHDVIPLLYPNHYPPGLRGKYKLLKQILLLKKVDMIITVSETSKKDIVRLLDLSPEKIVVIYEAPKKVFYRSVTEKECREVRKKYCLPDNFVLYVGDVNYNKNISGLAEACKIAKLPLVIVGKQAAEKAVDLEHPENRSFFKFLEKYKNDKQIFRLGFVTDEELVVIYHLASVYCLPSYYEGFGLSVLEAFASGTPVVIAKTQALVEIAGNAALIADPASPVDIANKLLFIYNSKKVRDSLITAGRDRVTEFSWEGNARNTKKIYEALFKT